MKKKPQRPPFVLTLAATSVAACSSPQEVRQSNPPVLEPPMNPPVMVPMNPPVPIPQGPLVAATTECPPRESMRDGGACTHAPSVVCYPREGCGSNGFECRDGFWHERFTTCNPPPPPRH